MNKHLIFEIKEFLEQCYFINSIIIRSIFIVDFKINNCTTNFFVSIDNKLLSKFDDNDFDDYIKNGNYKLTLRSYPLCLEIDKENWKLDFLNKLFDMRDKANEYRYQWSGQFETYYGAIANSIKTIV